MALSEIDRHLLERCLARQPRAWEDFVDRFMGLFVHVINHTAQARSIRLTPEDRDDLCADVALTIIRDDFALLRRFRGQSSLATYLAVVARRIVVRQMIERKGPSRLVGVSTTIVAPESSAPGPTEEQFIADRDEIERLLERLDRDEAEIVRLFHLQGKSYREISAATGLSENSIGPTLSRARQKMRQAELGTNPATP